MVWKNPAQFLGLFEEYESTISAGYVFRLLTEEIYEYLSFSISPYNVLE
ncbi:MAG: hypothetical protein WC179_00270 [Candidatus Cloacimonadaceae bacterium]|jgi:hypothetical protein|nr:hypothetical protein [Candidatus Cloacimonadota bacterium]MDY0112192.1 hypothetical protein [Candidatus Syntrophosphaera sp.]